MFSSENSFTVLYTTDVSKTAAFFKNLGVAVKQEEADKVVVGFGSFDLHYILNTSEPFEAYTYIAVSGSYGQGAIFYVETTDINELVERIPAAGGTLKSEVFQNKWNCRELLTEDPNGYKFAFYQAIS
ncbi:MAG TPA: hypothetical protein PK109_01430 [Candidatus Paceibacterota bacterium]|nr:hypothetical protein [Candidatus Paceibacterota bacterium]